MTMDQKNTEIPDASKPTGALIGDVLQRLSRLVRGEVALAKAEVEESLRSAARGVVMLVVALVLALVGLNVLAAALVAALAEAGLGPAWSALIVGGIAMVIAVILALVGKNALNPENLAPTRTAENVRRDAEMIKEIVNDEQQT
jgi:hypothetical protein